MPVSDQVFLQAPASAKRLPRGIGSCCHFMLSVCACFVIDIEPVLPERLSRLLGVLHLFVHLGIVTFQYVTHRCLRLGILMALGSFDGYLNSSQKLWICHLDSCKYPSKARECTKWNNFTVTTVNQRTRSRREMNIRWILVGSLRLSVRSMQPR
jgi:hypothetical protein